MMQDPNQLSAAYNLMLPHSNKATSWWLCFFWIDREGSNRFLYGCAARNFHPVGRVAEHDFEVPGGDRQLKMYQCTLNDEAFARFKDTLEAGTVDTSRIMPLKAFQANVSAKRIIIQEALGQSAVQTVLYYTLPDVQSLVGNTLGALERILSVLQAEFNLPFMNAYAGHFGNFEIFKLQPWLDAQSPFLIEAIPPSNEDPAGPHIMEICRAAEYSVVSHTAHLIGRVNQEVVMDKLIILPPGQRRVPIEVPERLEQFDFRIFSEDGQTLVHAEQATFLNRVGLILAPVSRQIVIEDELTQRARGKSRALASQASTVAVHSSHRSMIGAPAAGTWRKFSDEMTQRVASLAPASSEDKWFPRGIENEVGAITHFNHILDGGKISKAILVDAWFGAEALKRFVLRLGSQNFEFTIVTSWTNRNPDTNEKIDSTKELEDALNEVKHLLNPRLSLLNVVAGSDRAFHDRYLLIYPHEGHPKVFQLSNSINKMAGNSPFLICRVADDVAQPIRRYIEELCEDQDVAISKSLNINFRWPMYGTL